MQTAGNFLLFLSVLAAGYLFKLTFLQKMPGGDYGVGYSWLILLSIAAFWICISLVAGIIGWGGGYAWLGLGRFGGSGMLFLCFLVMFLGANLGMRGSFRIIPFLAPLNAVATPLVLLLAFAVLLNENLKMSISPALVKWGLAAVLALNGLVFVTMIFGGFVSRLGAIIQRSSGQLDSFQLGILDQIDSCDVNTDLVSLFRFSGDNQPRQIREKARLKIKSKPNWQDDLYQALEGDAVDDAFVFLLYNEVDDKPRFAKGVYQGVLKQARLIRQRLRDCSHPSHVYEGMFSYEVNRSLSVVEKFKDFGVDYKPAVAEMRAALDEPIAYENPNPSDKKALDKWLKKH